MYIKEMMEDNTMTNLVEENIKKEGKYNEIKACAILYPITTFCWVLSAGMILYNSVSAGKTPGWNFWMDLALAVVFGSCAVSYICKYRKQKKGTL